MFNVTIKTDLDGIPEYFDGRIEKTVRELEAAVIASCDPFVPYNTGKLCNSAHGSGVGESGEVTYSAPHAAVCYYAEREFNKKKHPSATARWFETAKAVDLEKWIDTAKKSLGGGRVSGGSRDSVLMPGGYSAEVY